MFTSLKNFLKRNASRAAARSGYGPDKDTLRYKVSNWLLTAPRATVVLGLSTVLLTCLIALFHILANRETMFSAEEHDVGLVFIYLRGFYFLGLGLLFPTLVLCFLRHRVNNLVIAVSIASAAVFTIWAASEMILWQPSSHLYHSGIAPARLPAIFRLLLVAGLILSPPLLVVLFRRAPIMDRYLLRQFLGPFILCSVGILAVWIIFDLQDNFSDFFAARATFGTVLHLYIVQLPKMIIFILPATLLLGLLYALGKMSKSNELVSMLSSGRSLVRILLPLLFVGAYLSLFCLALNYEWAPQAQAHKDSILDEIDDQRKINDGKKKKRKTIRASDIAIARNQVYPNREANRLWRIRYIPLDLSQKKMSGVEILERDDAGKLTKAIYAEKAGWHYEDREWFLRSSSTNRVKIFDFTQLDSSGTPLTTEVDEHIESGWTETPWNIVSEHLVADHLGIPALGFHLEANVDKPADKLAPFRAHWHHRWALPWNCLIVVLYAAPLGIGLSRRGVLGGVLGAIALFFVLHFGLGHFFLVLGQSNIMHPLVGAWTPLIIGAVIGVYLIYMRSMNKDLPKLSSLNPFSMVKKFRHDPLPATAAASAYSAPPAPLAEAQPAEAQERRTVAGRSTRRSSAKRQRASQFDLDLD